MPDEVNQLLGEYYRINAIRSEHRTAAQVERMQTLSAWYSKVWRPNYELMQLEEPADWKARGATLRDLSAAFVE